MNRFRTADESADRAEPETSEDSARAAAPPPPHRPGEAVWNADVAKVATPAPPPRDAAQENAVPEVAAGHADKAHKDVTAALSPTEPPEAPAANRNGGDKRKRRRLWHLFALIVAILVVLAAALLYLLPFTQPGIDCSAPPDGEVRDRHGVLLGYRRDGEGMRTQPLPPGPLPETLVRAVLCAEDARFYSHPGIDPLSVGRAVAGRLRGSSRSGASTISMQLVKISRPAGRRSLGTKIREALAARRLEIEHDKDDILRAYLNRVDLGNSCRGVEAAARYYYSLPAAELSLPQAALLAALIQAPGRLDPLRHPEAALSRVNALLKRLGAPPVSDLGLRILREQLPRGAAPGTLCLERGLQEACRRIAREEIDKLSGHHVSQAAVLIVHNPSGQVIARITSAFPESPEGGQLDGTRTRRSAGSTLKPFVYLLAFEKGLRPGSILTDLPTLYPDRSGIEAPHNYNRRYLGPISVRRALACSQNVPAMEALNRSGGPKALLPLLARFGIHPEGSAADYGLGLAIGNAHVTLEELAAAYTALARGGLSCRLLNHLPDAPSGSVSRSAAGAEPRGSADGEPGATEGSGAPFSGGERIADERLCYLVTDILSDVNARADSFGAGESLRFRFPCAAKTGTSSDYRDNWCVGYTGDYTVAVWVGNFDNSSMDQVSGISGAGPIFHRCMEELYSRRHPIPGPGNSALARPALPAPDAHSAALFGLRTEEPDIAAGAEEAGMPPCPDGLVRITIDSRTGLPAAEHTPPQYRARELALGEELPALRLQAAAPGLYDAEGRVLLNSRYADWLAGSGLQDAYACDPQRASDRRAAILVPANGSRLLLDSTLPNDGRLIELISTLPPARARWISPTLRLRRVGDRWFAELEPGEHSLIVEDSAGGASATSSFTVERAR